MLEVFMLKHSNTEHVYFAVVCIIKIIIDGDPGDDIVFIDGHLDM